MQETSQRIGTLEPPIPRFIGEGHMPELDEDRAVRKRAYFIWENEGRPHGRALEHWQRASAEERLRDEEKILEGRPDANIPTLLTKDVPGGWSPHRDAYWKVWKLKSGRFLSDFHDTK
jgi:hypothetical protein